MSGISLDTAKQLAFDTILEKIRQTGLYGESPSFFIIYAHENKNENENKPLSIGALANVVEDYISWFRSMLFNANKDKNKDKPENKPENETENENKNKKEPLDIEAHAIVAKDYISWFRSILFNAVSDQWTQGSGPILETVRPGAQTNIISNQLCLLPTKWGNSVDYALVFYSELLAYYMKEGSTSTFAVTGGPPQTFFDAIFQTCKKHEAIFKSCPKDDTLKIDACRKACEDDIRSVQERYRVAMGDKFHHVLTELALLRYRNDDRAPCETIPIFVGEKDMKKWEPDYQWHAKNLKMAESEVYETVRPGEHYRSFFKILLKFATLVDDQPLIKGFQTCFEKSVAAHRPGMTATDFKTKLAENIFEVYRSLHEGRVYQLKKPMLVGSLRDILDVYARDCATLKRVSGDDLPPGLNDIELEILPDAEPVGLKNEDAPTETVSLQSLFSRRTVGERDIQPYRVFVRGKPGVGKSTLCRRIMHDYSLNDGMRAKFELVVLVPVRKLDMDLSDILFTEYLRTAENGRRIARFLQDLILNSDKTPEPPKILVIMDGLDEARGWDSQKRDLLERLLRLPAVLVTSRTTYDASSGITFDLRADAVGLSMDSVKAFLNNRDIVSASTAKAIQRLISGNSAVREIVRVPIYLDIICSGWGEGSDADHTKQPTMATLYQGVMHSLWRKDIPRLHKLDHGELVTKETIQAVKDTSRLERVVEAEVMVLEQIAITMMEQNELEWKERYISAAIRRMEAVHGPMPLSLEKNLATLSVLRSSSTHYSFVHPTFQEFFAARHLARDLNRIKKYMNSHKYHPRFDMIWRFVVRLLSDPAHLQFFFEMLGQEPQDLLGPMHQRMVMRCLHEIDPKTELPIRSQLERELRRWVFFDCRANKEPLMLAEAEIPMSILRDVLEKPEACDILSMVKSLASSRAQFSAEVVSVLSKILAPSHSDASLQYHTVSALGSQANLPESVVLQLVENLNFSGQGVGFAAEEALLHQTTLSVQARAIIKDILNKDTRNAYLKRLRKFIEDLEPERPPNPTGSKSMNKTSPPDRYATALVPIWRYLPEPEVFRRVQVIRDGGSERKTCADELGWQLGPLPGEALSALEGLLNDSDQEAQAAGFFALLQKKANLQGPLISATEELLCLPSLPNYVAAWYHLRDYPHPLPGFGEVLERILEKHSWQNSDIRSQTLGLLERRYTVSENTFSTILTILEEPIRSAQDVKDRQASVNIVANQNLREGGRLADLAQILRRMREGRTNLEERDQGNTHRLLHLFAYSDRFMDKLPGYIGLSRQSESYTAGQAPHDGPSAPTICEFETLDVWYKLWLLRSLTDRFVLYVDDDDPGGRPPKLCLSQPSGLWTARFENGKDYTRFLDIAKRTRLVWLHRKS